MNTPIKFTTAEEAVKVIKSGDHVHLSSVASAPQCLIKAMCARGEAGELKNVHVHHLHTEGPAPYADLFTTAITWSAHSMAASVASTDVPSET